MIVIYLSLFIDDRYFWVEIRPPARNHFTWDMTVSGYCVLMHYKSNLAHQPTKINISLFCWSTQVISKPQWRGTAAQWYKGSTWSTRLQSQELWSVIADSRQRYIYQAWHFSTSTKESTQTKLNFRSTHRREITRHSVMYGSFTG